MLYGRDLHHWTMIESKLFNPLLDNVATVISVEELFFNMRYRWVIHKMPPQVGNWHAMVDSVMIDSTYDGEMFDITLAGVPIKRNDLVGWKYGWKWLKARG